MDGDRLQLQMKYRNNEKHSQNIYKNFLLRVKKVGGFTYRSIRLIYVDK